MTSFASAFGRTPETAWFSPGRVNLIGEHTDYNEGFVLPFAVPFGVRAEAARRDDGILRMVSAQIEGEPVEVGLDELKPGVPEGWGSYVAGMAWALRESGVDIAGADLFLDGDVPQGAGLSSSHALECAVGAAIAALVGAGPAGSGPSGMDLAVVTQHAENDYVGAPTGIMDQAASILSQPGHALLIDCRSLVAEPIALPLAEAGLAVLVIDTRAPHSHVDGEYAARRRDCERAAALLGIDALRDVELPGLASALERIGAAIDDQADADVVRRRVRHIVTENARVLEAVSLLRAGDLAGIGPVLTASHASMRDDFEISCRELDSAVDSALAAGAMGARMTGGGFGGSAIALVAADEVPAVSAAVIAAAESAGLATPHPFAVTPSAGLRQL